MNNFFLRQSYIMIYDELVHLVSRKRAIFAFLLYAGTLFVVFWSISQSKELFQNIIKMAEISETDKILLIEASKNISIPQQARENVPFLNLSIPVIIYYLVSVLTIPFLIPMISCDMISRDLQRGTQRFLLFRVSRPVYYLSRAFSHFSIYLIIQFLILITTAIFVIFFMKEVSFLQVMKEGLLITSRLVPLTMAFLSLIQLISGFTSSPVKSLVYCNLVLIIMMFILAFVPWMSLFYSPLWKGLFSFETKKILISMLGFSTWSAVFWGSGFLLFFRRQM